MVLDADIQRYTDVFGHLEHFFRKAILGAGNSQQSISGHDHYNSHD